MKLFRTLFLLIVAQGFASLAYSQSTAQPVLPGILVTSGCPSGYLSCYVPYSGSNPLPVSVAGSSTSSEATATAAAPSYTEGTVNPISQNLTGDQRVIAKQSGTWTNTVTQATAASLNATIVGTGTLAVQNTAATPAGTAIVGKVGIDQTTPGTTNGVSATNFPTTVSVGSGASSASTPRVITATDSTIGVEGQDGSTQSSLTNPVPTANVPFTSGGVLTFSQNITTAGSGAGTGGVAVKASAGQIYGYMLMNNNSTVCYAQILDASQANTNLGTTAPKLSIGVPANGGANVFLATGIPFATAITAAATTTRAGSTACATGIDYNVLYF